MVKKQTAIRVNAVTMKALKEIAKRSGEKVSEVMRRALDEFVRNQK